MTFRAAVNRSRYAPSYLLGRLPLCSIHPGPVDVRLSPGGCRYWEVLRLLSNIASIATTGGVLVVIYAAYVAVGQLREMTRARNLEAMLRVYEIIGTESARSSRRFIHGELASKPESITPEERDHIENVAVALDQVGALVEAGLVPIGPLFSSHGEMICRSREKLAPHVRQRRQTIDATFAAHFEQLADSALHYLATRPKAIRIAEVESLRGNAKIRMLPKWLQRQTKSGLGGTDSGV